MHNGKALKKADPSTIQDKLLVGYQGWFTCAGDGEPGTFAFVSSPAATSVCLLTLPILSICVALPVPDSCETTPSYGMWNSWKRTSRMAPLVQLPRARWWAPKYRHLARRVRVRSLGIIRSAGAQNSGWREMLLVLFKESEDGRQVRPHRTCLVASLGVELMFVPGYMLFTGTSIGWRSTA